MVSKTVILAVTAFFASITAATDLKDGGAVCMSDDCIPDHHIQTTKVCVSDDCIPDDHTDNAGVIQPAIFHERDDVSEVYSVSYTLPTVTVTITHFVSAPATAATSGDPASTTEASAPVTNSGENTSAVGGGVSTTASEITPGTSVTGVPDTLPTDTASSPVGTESTTGQVSITDSTQPTTGEVVTSAPSSSASSVAHQTTHGVTNTTASGTASATATDSSNASSNRETGNMGGAIFVGAIGLAVLALG